MTAKAGINNTLPGTYDPNWLQGVDKRTSIGRQLVARYASLVADLGGESQLSYIQKSLCTRYLWLEYRVSQMEQAMGDGKADFDQGQWTQAVNSLQGLASKLGLKLVKREVSLSQYLAGKEGAQ